MKPFFLLLLLTACDRWSGASASEIWKLPAHRIGVPDDPASLYATTTPSGDTIAVVFDARIGDRDLSGSHIVRIDPDGTIVQTVAVADIGDNAALAVAADDRGRPVAVWGSSTISWIVAFDEALAPRWKLSSNGTPNYSCCLDLANGIFDVGPQGQVAFAQMDANGYQTVHYVGDDGVERWAVTAQGTNYAHPLRIATDGDLLAFGIGRLATANGARRSNIDAPARASTRDGVSVSLDIDQLVVREPSGAIRWQTTIQGIGYCPFGGCIREPSARNAVVALTPSEDVLVQLYQTQEQLLDRSSGEREGATEHCGSPAILDVNDTGYLALGPSCDSSQGLARHHLPE